LSRALHAPLLVLLLGAACSVGSGCGSPTCAETATCPGAPGPGDAQRESDTSDAPATSSEAGDATTPLDATDEGPVDAPGAQESSACDPHAPDCANPGCTSAFVCVPVTPSGWSGPVALSDQGGGPPEPTPPACAGAFGNDAFDGNAEPTVPPPNCACACGAAQNICSPPTVSVYDDNVCMTSCGSASPSSSCTPTCSSAVGLAAKVTAEPTPTGTGTCASSAVPQGATPAWQWTRTGRGCAATQAFSANGCSAGQVCVPRPSSPFSPSLCVWTHASATCSAASGYPVQHSYYSRVSDTRACAAGSCVCGSPTGVSCTLTSVTVSSGCGSTGAHLGSVSMGTCNYTAGQYIGGVAASVTASGQCTPSGSPAAAGDVQGDVSTAYTVCCVN
jgi:hypothetical protein